MSGLISEKERPQGQIQAWGNNIFCAHPPLHPPTHPPTPPPHPPLHPPFEAQWRKGQPKPSPQEKSHHKGAGSRRPPAPLCGGGRRPPPRFFLGAGFWLPFAPLVLEGWVRGWVRGWGGYERTKPYQKVNECIAHTFCLIDFARCLCPKTKTYAKIHRSRQ